MVIKADQDVAVYCILSHFVGFVEHVWRTTDCRLLISTEFMVRKEDKLPRRGETFSWADRLVVFSAISD